MKGRKRCIRLPKDAVCVMVAVGKHTHCAIGSRWPGKADMQIASPGGGIVADHWWLQRARERFGKPNLYLQSVRNEPLDARGYLVTGDGIRTLI